MTSSIRARRNEEGFTLIELLVVVIIIGILAAIAIPAFLNQRERAWQAELSSTVRNVALEIEAEATIFGGDYQDINATAAGTYAVADFNGFVTTAMSALQTATGPVDYVDAVAGDVTPTSFVICMTHESLLNAAGDAALGSVTYDSALGGLQDFAPTGTCAAAPA
jgi:type IV pilus assembly protein PilA